MNISHRCLRHPLFAQAASVAVHDLQVMCAQEISVIRAALKVFLVRKRISQLLQRGARMRRRHARKSWAQFEADLTSKQFRRYFRMDKECFSHLCERIEEIRGEEEFKSENYLAQVRRGNAGDPKLRGILRCHNASTGGFISGEVKAAITLRLLAGRSYVDLALVFSTGFTHAHNIFDEVLSNWLLDDRLVKINGIEYCSNESAMQEVALEFARDSSGIINGCICAIDGWVVKIQKPRLSDGVRNPGSFYSRKGYYTLNVQEVIVDRKKRVLYRKICSRGAEHDSTAFKNTKLYQYQTTKWKWFAQAGFFFIGDSAYSLRSFLVTPYDNVLHGTSEDNFNFFHSSS